MMIKAFKISLILAVSRSFVGMVISDDLGVEVWQTLELNFTRILLRCVGFYSSVWLHSGDKEQTVTNW